MTILYKVLYMSHFMMNGNQTPLVDVGADFHAEILTIAEVPGRRFAENTAIERLLEKGILIKFGTYRRHINGGEELLGQLEH